MNPVRDQSTHLNKHDIDNFQAKSIIEKHYIQLLNTNYMSGTTLDVSQVYLAILMVSFQVAVASTW